MSVIPSALWGPPTPTLAEDEPWEWTYYEQEREMYEHSISALFCPLCGEQMRQGATRIAWAGLYDPDTGEAVRRTGPLPYWLVAHPECTLRFCVGLMRDVWQTGVAKIEAEP